MPDQNIGLFSFLSLWHEWLRRCWVGVVPLFVSHIEGVSAKAFTELNPSLWHFEPLHCCLWSVCKLSNRSGFRRTVASHATKVYWKCFHCGDCGASIHVSETHVVINCEGVLVVKIWRATIFNRAFSKAVSSHVCANVFHPMQIVCDMFRYRPEVHHPHCRPPSLLGSVSCQDDPHFANWSRGFRKQQLHAHLWPAKFRACPEWRDTPMAIWWTQTYCTIFVRYPLTNKYDKDCDNIARNTIATTFITVRFGGGRNLRTFFPSYKLGTFLTINGSSTCCLQHDLSNVVTS